MQRDQIEAWAQMQGASLGEVFEELDESGARSDRPLLNRAIQRVERGESNGVVVAKLDRFGRSLIDALAAIERIRAAGGTFVSVQDGLDLSTDTGKLVARIMFSMAEWELDRIRATWEIAKVRAIERGVHVGKQAPIGYRRDEDGALQVDAAKAPVIREVFERRARGVTVSELCRWLEGRGFLTGNGNRGWTRTSLCHILENRTYLGELHSGAHVATGTHPRLVDDVTWQLAQNPRVLPPRRNKRPTLLGGLLRCWACRMVLHSQVEARSGGRLSASYACHGRSAGGHCGSPAYIAGSIVEPHVELAFFSAVRSQARRRSTSKKRLAHLEEQSQEATEDLLGYRDAPRIVGTLGVAGYIAGLESRQQRLAAALGAVGREKRRLDPFGIGPAGELESRWPRMSIHERRAAIAAVVDCIFVRRGRHSVEDRTVICYRGTAPLDLPRPGMWRREIHAIDPDQLPKPLPIRAAPKWPKPRIQAELDRFLAQRTIWPRPEEFHAAGRGPLFQQIMRSGGPGYWARRVGFPAPRGSRGVRKWDEGWIRDSLSDYLRHKKRWPTQKEFRSAGLGALYSSLTHHGGVELWASRYGPSTNQPGKRGFDLK